MRTALIALSLIVFPASAWCQVTAPAEATAPAATTAPAAATGTTAPAAPVLPPPPLSVALDVVAPAGGDAPPELGPGVSATVKFTAGNYAADPVTEKILYVQAEHALLDDGLDYAGFGLPALNSMEGVEGQFRLHIPVTDPPRQVVLKALVLKPNQTTEWQPMWWTVHKGQLKELGAMPEPEARAALEDARLTERLAELGLAATAGTLAPGANAVELTVRNVTKVDLPKGRVALTTNQGRFAAGGAASGERSAVFQIPALPAQAATRVTVDLVLGEGDRLDRLELSGVYRVGGFEAPLLTTTWGAADGRIARTAREHAEGELVEILLGRKEVLGTLRGFVIDANTGEGIIEARVQIPALGKTARTDLDGNYSTRIPPGTYDVRVVAPPLQTKEFKGVDVQYGRPTVLDVAMGGDEETAIQEVVVEGRPDKTRAAVQLVIRKQATVVSDSLSSEEMSKAADSSASDAVRRAVGASVVGGKFVFVRGLGERYSYTQLNGAKLPSPEPGKKVVPLDIFPTGVMSSLQIVKTAQADLPADFAGGVVQIATKEFPEETILKASASYGWNSLTTFRPVDVYDGGGLDWTGFDDGARSWPDGVPEDGKLIAGSEAGGVTLSQEDLVTLGRAFTNDYEADTRGAFLNQSYSLTYGDTVEAGTMPLGYLFSAGYGNKYQHSDQIRRILRIRSGQGADAVELERKTDFTGDEDVHQIQWNTLGNVNIRLTPRNKLNYTLLYTQKTDISARTLSGFEQQFDGFAEYTSQDFVRRGLFFNGLGGEHDVGPVMIDWQGTYSRAVRDQPDWRELVRVRNNAADPLRWLDKSSSGSHFYSDLAEPAYTGELNLTVPFRQWDRLQGNVKLGSAVSVRDRSFEVRRLRFLPMTGAPAEFYTLPPSELIADDQIGTNIRFQESTRPQDSYDASEEVFAGYAMTDLPLIEQLRLIAGVRYEKSIITVTTLDPFAATNQSVESRLENDDYLPSANLVWYLNDTTNFRVGASRTLARPDFRELSPFALSSFFSGQEVKGDPNLNETRINNYDLRIEHFPGSGEVLAVSLFYKQFKDPIEQVIIPSAQQTISFANAEEARNFGAELEARKNLGFMGDWALPFYGAGNLTYVRSDVKLDPNSGIQTNDERPLQGQSDILFNTVLGFNHQDRINAQLSYNVYSERIAQVGAFGMPDIYEQPFHALDFTYIHGFADHWQVKLSAENLLDEALDRTQGEELVYQEYEGISASVGISYEY